MPERRRVMKVISGGQTGADTGALLAARELGLETGGLAPQGWWTEEGPRESLLRSFGLVECGEPGYPARTRQNVLLSDGTLLVGPYDSGGSAFTNAVAREANRPIFYIPFSASATPNISASQAAAFHKWLETKQIRILNVAGNRESNNPGIQEFTRGFLLSALR
jgi:hypothetical protein